MKQPKRYTVTAALPYTNGPLHIGHLAGVYIPADIYTRIYDLRGKRLPLFVGAMNMVLQLLSKQRKKEKLHRKLLIIMIPLLEIHFKPLGLLLIIILGPR